ncbi:polyamine aminopropyltransferase [Flexithrix dorotheae]|uniref:polyamine aminopropyltransferase n=1 Tax=Flexithrix dorotheae TaxID=70993 RepID=UPI0003752D85|nr:polyamine aminopropyltransferase [Flexithrix dorotheae]
MESLGKHIIAEFFNCNPEGLNDVVFIENAMLEAAKEANATVINSTFHHFSPIGVSGVVVIQESHLAIHTWPEYGFASVDIFTCGDQIDPWLSSRYLKKALEASHDSAIEMRRGQKGLIEKQEGFKFNVQKSVADLAEIRKEREIWVTERTDDLALSFRHTGELLFRTKSDFQRIEVFQSRSFGKIMLLDGIIVLTEKDEFAFHEMLVHVPLLCHPNPKQVMVIGGGDGGTVKELLKHPEIEQITVLEIDPQVIQTAKTYFPEISAGLNDNKVKVILGEAFDYLKNESSQKFDIILSDYANPVEEGAEEHFKHIHLILKKHLKEKGILIAQTGSPGISGEKFAENFKGLKNIFGAENVKPFQVNIPTFPSGLWTFGFCQKDISNNNFPDKSRLKQLEADYSLNYYNEEIHKAAFVLPNYVRRLV